MGLAHYGIPVGAHFKAMKEFYIAALKPIGYKLMFDPDAEYCGFGTGEGRPDFWLGGGRKEAGLKTYDGELTNRVAPIHFAFEVETTELVDQWYEAAIKAGGVDNGKPGPREAFGYYAAFVLDPLGNNVEVLYMSKK